MRACQDYAENGAVVVSPHLQNDRRQVKKLTPAQLEAMADNKRSLWKKWSAQINNEWG
jgi:hypothetical protein